jgi:hypothetical protein
MKTVSTWRHSLPALAPQGRAGLVLWTALGLGACTAAPHVDHVNYDDAWGDRGAQVFARDTDWCIQAVESRRSLLAGCLHQRGWVAQLP